MRDVHLGRGEVGGPVRLPIIVHDDGHDLPSALSECSRDDVQRTLHGLEVVSGYIDEEVVLACCDRGQRTVDDRGEREDVPIPVLDDGIPVVSVQEVCVVDTLLVFLQDLLHVHLLGLGEGDESDGVGVCEPVCERGIDLVQVVDSDGELAPLPSDGDVQLLLHLHYGPEEFIVDVHIEHSTAAEVGSDPFDALVHEDLDVALPHIVGLHTRLDVQEGPHSPGETLDAVEVGTVREELHGHVVAFSLGLVHVGTDHGDPIDQRLLGDLLSQHRAEVAVFEVDNRHVASIREAL